jgi:NO-binding membrane sensor protein with MHYT domain
MFAAFGWLSAEHDWRLIALAAVICFLASVAVIGLLHRARVSAGGGRAGWAALAAVTAGCGIWATHFIAILAYQPGVPRAYGIGLTLLALLFGIGISGAGLATALNGSGRVSSALGGGIIGFGLAATHYGGMLALQLPARLSFDPLLVALSIAAGVLLGAAALVSAPRRPGLGGTLLVALLITLAVVGHHFTAMQAVGIIPDPSQAVDGLLQAPGALALIIAGAATTIVGMALVAALSDRRAADRLQEERLKLHAAVENMPLGVCMFDPQGSILLFNERYAALMGLEPDFLRGRSLLDVFRRRKETGAFQGDPEPFFAHVRAEMNAGKQKTR